MPSTIMSCVCGGMPKLEIDMCGVPKMEIGRPPGRMGGLYLGDLYRLACHCGQASPHWLDSARDAIRLWNEFVSSTMGRLVPD